MIRLLLRSFVLIQSSPKGFWVSMCVYVLTIPMSFPYFDSVILFFSENPLFSLALLACCLPTTHKHMQTPCKSTYTLRHIVTHTHHPQFTVLRMADGRRGSACGGCQIRQYRGGILVNELRKYSSHTVSTWLLCMYVWERKERIDKKSISLSPFL